MCSLLERLFQTPMAFFPHLECAFNFYLSIVNTFMHTKMRMISWMDRTGQKVKSTHVIWNYSAYYYMHVLERCILLFYWLFFFLHWFYAIIDQKSPRSLTKSKTVMMNYILIEKKTFKRKVNFQFLFTSLFYHFLCIK